MTEIAPAEEICTDREVDARADQNDQHDRSPYDTVDCLKNRNKTFHLSSPLLLKIFTAVTGQINLGEYCAKVPVPLKNRQAFCQNLPAPLPDLSMIP
jgi:hypothetical protein